VTNTCREGDETISSSTLEAFPNPFNNFTRIDLSELNPDEDQLHVLITDLSGKILFQNVFSSLSQIEIGNELRAGFYLVEVNGKNYHQVIPIVKE
jgi:hypothetical protein